MRTRSRSTPSSSYQGTSAVLHNASWQQYQGTHQDLNIDSSWYGCQMGYKSYESITDTFPSQAGRPFQYVEHTKVEAATRENFSIQRTGYYGYWVEIYVNGLYMSPTQSTVSARLGGIQYSLDWPGAIVTLARQVRGLIETKSLLGVSLVELPKTIRMVKKPFAALKPMWREICGNRSARSLAKSNAKLWLESQYGWNATYVDMKNFSSSTSKYMRYDRLWRENARRQYGSRLYTVGSTPAPTVSDAEWASSYMSFNDGTSSSVFPMRIIFSPPVVRGSVSCAMYEAIQNRADSLERLLGAYGLTADTILETIWELLPYSFVVDWFVNTENIWSALKYSDAIKTLSSVRVRNLGYSMKIECDFSGAATTVLSSRWDGWCGGPGNTSPKEIVANKGKIVYYLRQVGYPAGWQSLIETEGLRSTQLLSGAALLTRFLR